MIGLVFPHQCFQDIPRAWTEIRFIRHDIGYGGKHTPVADFHIQRKIFLRACEMDWIAAARKKGLRVRILDRNETWYTEDAVEYWDPVDHMLDAEIRKHCPRAVRLESPAFLLTAAEALDVLGDGAHDSHAAFYAAMRTRFGILLKPNGDPLGGRFRFDTDNRQAIGPTVDLPDWEAEQKARRSRTGEVEAAVTAFRDVLDKGDHLGIWTGHLAFPTNHADAYKALQRFAAQRLHLFGPYQDAIVGETKDDDADFLFHSVLSPCLNAGLLTPADVLYVALSVQQRVPLPSLEGFVAQVLGWREFMRAVYLKRPHTPPNRLRHNRRLSTAWYDGTTGLLPVDVAVARVQKNAYLHHIERLMVVGNAMFLCDIRPTEVYRWFMEMFADSYDWVMIGNVYYMSQWASDAITTKPYISSSAYILRMSDYGRRDEWTSAWDALYWRTVHRLGPLLRRNYRMAAQVAFWERKSAAEKREIARVAEGFLKHL